MVNSNTVMDPAVVWLGVRDHRSLHAWVEAREISRITIRMSRMHGVPYGSAVLWQGQRAARAIELNIAEGYVLADKGRFGNHLAIVYWSAVETWELVDLALPEQTIPVQVGQPLLDHGNRCRRRVLGLLKRYRPIPRR